MTPTTRPFDLSQLTAALDGLAPAPLKGFTLLDNPTRLTDRDAVREAVLELITYTDACARACQRLTPLPAVPLTAFVVVEWAL